MIFDWKRFIESQYWGSKASGILPICKSTGRIGIGLRSHWVNQPNTWGNFGGAIGLGHYGESLEEKSPEENAMDELREETGFYGEVELIPSYVFEKPDFKYYNFIGIVDKEFELDLSDIEHIEVTQIIWVTLEELLKKDNIHSGLKEMITQSIDQLESVISTYTG